MDLSRLAAVLGAVVLERLPDRRFARRSEAPLWWLARVDDPHRETFDLREVFPFLEVFLIDAERVWATPHAAPITSELWTEVDADGQDIHLEALATRLGDARVLVIIRNDPAFVERQLMLQRARELRMTYDALMREIEHKDILLHTIVHDLTAPLHSIVGALSLLRERELPAAEMRWTELAIEAASRQRELIQGILDVFVSERTPVMPTEPVDLARTILRAVAEREPVARQRRVELDSQLGAMSRVNADETRLLRVLTNLLDNAIRHTPAGTCVRIATREEPTGVLISVEDDGPGVAPELIPRLFQKLARDPRGGGTGLGLYFCRITVEEWGGGIGYEPSADGGACFWIRLPLPVARYRAERRLEAHG